MVTQPAALSGSGWIGMPAPLAIEPGDVLSALDVPVVAIHSDFAIASFNGAGAAVLGLSPSDIGRRLSDICTPAGLPDIEKWCAKAIATEAPTRHDFRKAHHFYVLRIAPCATATRDASGVVLTFVDITAFRASMEQALYDREYTKAILNTVADPLLVLSADQRLQTANRTFHAMFDVSREEISDRPLGEVGNHVFDVPRLRTQLRDMLDGQQQFQSFEIDQEVDGAVARSLVVNAQPLSLPGRPERQILLILHDITARKRAEEHRDLLLRELDHRVKNTLAIVQSMAMQSMLGAPEPKIFYETFEARLLALAKAHSLLAQEGWNGASLRTLVLAAFAPYQEDTRQRWTLNGQDITLPSQMALALARGLHELITNAIKYGALSVPTGHIEVTWRLDDGPRLHFAWTEVGGPPVKVPERRGFGSRLIEKGLAYELNCNVGLVFDPSGVRCTLDIPMGSHERT